MVILMAPVWLQKQYDFSPTVTLQANSIATIMLSLGCLLARMAIDSFGAGKPFISGSILLGCSGWLFYHTVGEYPEMLFWLYGLAGFSVGIVGAVPYVLVRIFPAEVRFTGISFSYNVAYAVVGGLTPVVVTMLTEISPMAPAWYVMLLSLVGSGLGIWFCRDPRLFICHADKDK